MHDASITDMHNNLKCKSVEPCREQFSLIMLYNILKRNTNRTIRIHSMQSFTPRHHSTNYKLDMFRL